MKPVKNLQAFSKWMLRLAVAGIVYIQFFQTFIDFNIKNISFLIAAIYVVFAVLLLVGGFLSNGRLSVICGLIILITSLVRMFLPGISIFSVMNNLTLTALGIFFLAYGNTK